MYECLNVRDFKTIQIIAMAIEEIIAMVIVQIVAMICTNYCNTNCTNYFNGNFKNCGKGKRDISVLPGTGGSWCWCVVMAQA